jgi:hypothetical protein
MRCVDRLRDLPDISGRLAFGLNRVDINVGLLPHGQFQFRFVQLQNLRLQQRIDRPVWIPCVLRSGYVDEGHRVTPLGARS